MIKFIILAIIIGIIVYYYKQGVRISEQDVFYALGYYDDIDDLDDYLYDDEFEEDDWI